jgi:proteasome lid subunit RPN8/RPN11
VKLKSKNGGKLALRINSNTVREIRRHARAHLKTEVCGVLIGSEAEGVTSIEACIAGANATQGGAHVTFTQDTWEHIYKIKDREYPDERIVGWYHSHPGFGVFLSDHDTFIHKNFFSSEQQVAWVYDPHSDEEGCFGWRDGRIERMPQFAVVDRRGGEVAEATGRPEPRIAATYNPNDMTEERSHERSTEDTDLSQLWRTVSAVFSHLAIFLLGALLVWYLFPRVMLMPVPVDPRTGRPLTDSQPMKPGNNSEQSSGAGPKNEDRTTAHPERPKSGEIKKDDVHQ